jgi:hypothetical protein
LLVKSLLQAGVPFVFLSTLFFSAAIYIQQQDLFPSTPMLVSKIGKENKLSKPREKAQTMPCGWCQSRLCSAKFSNKKYNAPA